MLTEKIIERCEKTETKMKKIVVSAVIGAMMALSGGAAMADAKNPKIGFSIDDLRLERWARDRDYFTAEAEKLGAKVYEAAAIIDLPDLGGSQLMVDAGIPTYSLCAFAGNE